VSPSQGRAEPGLSWRHRKQRAAALAAFVGGEQCPYAAEDPLCPGPMWEGQQLDLDHATPRVLGGTGHDSRLAHASCNRRAGARLGNRLRGARRRGVADPDLSPSPTSRDW
jgi:hypothetical protein